MASGPSIGRRPGWPDRKQGIAGGVKRVVVIGGGITGLSAAWFLNRKGVEVRVIEAAGRVGGVIDTVRHDGFLVERGPNTTLRKPGRPDDALGRLLEQSGLDAIAREADPAGHKRFILRGGRVLALPSSPPAFLATGAFSLPAKLRLLREPFIGRGSGEETIAQFVTRRLGREFLDYAVDPFISGVYAGDTAKLSVRAAVPRIFELEQQYGSLIRGAIALGKAAKNAGQPSGRQISFADGMAALPAGIAAKLPAGCVRTGTRARALERTENGWTIHLADRDTPETADAVIVALPADKAAELVRPLAPKTADILDEQPYVGITTTGLGYRREQVAHALDGFGFLIPRVEGVRSLGALFSSSLFAGRAPDGHVLLTAFMGGAHDPQAPSLDDDTLAAALQVDLARCLGITGEPVFRRITRWDRAIPQYALGHLDRMAEIDRDLDRLPGLHLQSAWRGGISVADCIRSAEALAERIGD